MVEIEVCAPYMKAFMPMVYWSVLFNVLTFVVFPRINAQVKSISAWKKSQKNEVRHLASLDWDVRCTSILNAFSVFSIVSYCLFVQPDGLVWYDIKQNSLLGTMAMQMCGGYFICDFIVVIICRNYYPGVSDYVIHHIVAISAFVLADKESALVWFANVRLLSEFSTPFVNMRWMLLQVNLRQTVIYSVNRHMTFWAFLLFRILPIPIYWGACYYHYGSKDWNHLGWQAKVVAFLSGVALDFLNINWFLKLARGIQHTTTTTTNKKDENTGVLKSEDPTEGSIFGRVNVKTKILIEEMRRKSYEKIYSFNAERRRLVDATLVKFRSHIETHGGSIRNRN